MSGILYCISNRSNAKQYIGQTWQPLRIRWNQHKSLAGRVTASSRSYLHRALGKHGIGSFAITQMCTSDDPEELDELEELAIEINNTLAPHGYNIRAGPAGKGGVRTSGYKRAHPDDEGLPAGISAIRHSSGQGYCARHFSSGTQKMFSSRHLDMAAKLQLARQWLQQAAIEGRGNTDLPRARLHPDDRNLPKGVCCRRAGRKTPVYTVRLNGSRQTFKSQQEALTYHNNMMNDSRDDPARQDKCPEK